MIPPVYPSILLKDEHVYFPAIYNNLVNSHIAGNLPVRTSETYKMPEDFTRTRTSSVLCLRRQL